MGTSLLNLPLLPITHSGPLAAKATHAHAHCKRCSAEINEAAKPERLDASCMMRAENTVYSLTIEIIIKTEGSIVL